MNIQLSDHFSYKRLLRFTLPSVAMMIFTSIYGVVDGYFVSNFVGKTPFAAVNFIMPVIMALGACGFLFGTGGSALISKTMGEGDREKANQQFSLFVYVALGCGILIAAAGLFTLRPIASLLGAQGEMLEACVVYGRILIAAVPAFVLQMAFQSFFVAAEKPGLGLVVTVASGVSNMVLDAVLVAMLRWGLEGAAAATAISQFVGAVISVIYFMRKNTSLLRLGKTKWDGKSLLKGCVNGSSELVSNVSMSAVSMLYNVQLIQYAGEDGVAAYGVLMYVNLFFLAAFIGFSVGTAPIISYHYGAKNHAELKNLLRKSLVLISVVSVAMLLLSEALAAPLSHLFVGYAPSLFELTKRAFFFFSFSFLLAGVNIFCSSFFTALNNGMISALLSFLRTLVFQVAAVMLLPLLFGIDGIWISVVVAELLAFLLSIAFLVGKRKKYQY